MTDIICMKQFASKFEADINCFHITSKCTCQILPMVHSLFPPKYSVPGIDE